MFSEAKAAAEIYDERYSAGYDVLYIAPWLRKHRVNLAVLKTIDALKKPDAVWIDTCCGQGWHFTHCDSPGTKIGIDCSAAQLAFARRNNSSARFVCADVLACRFRQKSVSLLTNFWGSYCYFGDAITIAEFFRRCCRAIRPDGALYWEILTIEALESFNRSAFAKDTGLRIESISGINWTFVDPGGTHRMTSPPLDAFTRIADTLFGSVRSFHDGRFMHHLICSAPLSSKSREEV